MPNGPASKHQSPHVQLQIPGEWRYCATTGAVVDEGAATACSTATTEATRVADDSVGGIQVILAIIRDE